MSIWLTGDIHGDPSRFSIDNFHEQKGMTKENDYVIILGDFGLVWDYKGENKTEKYWLDWIDTKPFTTLFIDGNHENFDRLDTMPVANWHGGKINFIRPSVIHLMRGQVFRIEGKSFFTFGGGSSHDIRDGILEKNDSKINKWNRDYLKQYRINHVSWWERELPNETEMSEGLINLEKCDNKVDYILTHSPYTSLLKQMDGGSGIYQADILTDYLEKIKQNVDYKHWLFGHMHVNQTYYWERSSCLYEQIIRIL